MEEKTQLDILPCILAVVQINIASDGRYCFYAVYHKDKSISMFRKSELTVFNHSIIFDIRNKELPKPTFFNTILTAINKEGNDASAFLEDEMKNKDIYMIHEYKEANEARNEALLVFLYFDRLSYGFYGFSNSLISTVDTIYTIAINRRKENIFITPTYSEIIKHYKKEK